MQKSKSNIFVHIPAKELLYKKSTTQLKLLNTLPYKTIPSKMTIVSCSFVLMLLMSVVSFPHFINASLSDACTAAAAKSPNVNREFCVTSLQMDPKSASANFVGLAQIATKLASNNATSTKAKIHNLLAQPGNGNIKSELSTCQDLYSGMIDNLSDAASAIISFHYDDAITFLSAAIDAPNNCEEAFSEKGIASVLSEEDANATQLSAIALAFLNI